MDDLIFVSKVNIPNLSLLLGLEPGRFWWGVVLVLLVVTGVKQSQLLDLSIGLGLEFDKKVKAGSK